MKKMLCIFWSVVLILSLTACSNSSQETSDDAPTEVETIQTEPVQSEPVTENDGKPVVYMTTNISPYGLTEIYEALNWIPAGEVAVKLSTGEPPASHYLSPELIADLVQTVDGGGFLGLRFLSDSLTF